MFTTAIYDPATSPRQLFPGNTIPASRFDPIAVAGDGALPAAQTSAGAANNYTRTGVEPENRTSSMRVWTA